MKRKVSLSSFKANSGKYFLMPAPPLSTWPHASSVAPQLPRATQPWHSLPSTEGVFVTLLRQAMSTLMRGLWSHQHQWFLSS